MYYQEKLEKYEELQNIRDEIGGIRDEIIKDIRNKFNTIAIIEDHECQEYRYMDEYIEMVRFDGASIKIFMKPMENCISIKELAELNELFNGELEMLYTEYLNGKTLAFILWDDRDDHYFVQGIVTMNQH